MCEALKDRERKRERQDKQRWEKGRKKSDIKGQIFYHSIYKLVLSEVTELRAVASNGGGGLDQREWGNCIQIAAASGITVAKHCGHTGVTSPGLLAHTCDLSKLEVVRGRGAR